MPTDRKEERERERNLLFSVGMFSRSSAVLACIFLQHRTLDSSVGLLQDMAPEHENPEFASPKNYTVMALY